MKKSLIIWIVVGCIVLAGFLGACSSYNSLITQKTGVEKAWSDVEATYQRRADLIPNFVNTVKGYAKHEKETLEGIVAERASATQPQVNFEDLNDQTLAQYQASQNQVGAVLGRLLAITENYPDLKASTNFLALQDELSGTENRITTARRDYNEAVRKYNVYVQTFPRNLIAGMFNFTPKVMFAADKGAEKAPEVNF